MSLGAIFCARCHGTGCEPELDDDNCAACGGDGFIDDPTVPDVGAIPATDITAETTEELIIPTEPPPSKVDGGSARLHGICSDPACGGRCERCTFLSSLLLRPPWIPQ